MSKSESLSNPTYSGVLPRQEPLRIVTDKLELDITSTTRNKRIQAHITPVGSLDVYHVETWKGQPQELEVPQEELNMVETTQSVILAALAYKAAKMSPGSELIEPELALSDVMNNFEEDLIGLYNKNYNSNMINQIIKRQGRIFSGVAPASMGIPGDAVRSVIAGLGSKVDQFFIDMEEEKKAS